VYDGYVITLVHGTFARDAAWTRPNSALCTHLAAHLGAPVIFSRFQWSGRNSFRARRRAGNELAIHLAGLSKQYPRSGHYVITHSHGGAVAFYAAGEMKHQEVRGLVCLSAPFLHVRQRPWNAAALGPVAIGLMCWPFLMLSERWGYRKLLSFDVTPVDVSTGGILLFVLGLLLAVSLVIGAVVFASLGTEKWVRLMRLPQWRTDRTLIIRSSGDEASGLLTTTQFVSFVLNRLVSLPAAAVGHLWDWISLGKLSMSAQLLALIGLVVVGLVLEVTDPAWYEPINIWGRYVVVALVLASTALSLLFALTVLVSGLLLMSFGPGMAIAGALLDVTAETTPPGGPWAVFHAKESQPDSLIALKHSETYVSAEVLRLVAGWIKADEAGAS